MARLALVFFSLVACAPAGEDSGSDLYLPEDREEVPVEWMDRTLSKGSYYHAYFTKTAGCTYTVSITETSGSCRLYGHYTTYPTTGSYQFSGSTADSFSFSATSTGTYYLSVYGSSIIPSCQFTGPTVTKSAC